MSDLSDVPSRQGRRHEAQWVALVIGGFYTLIGALGFLVTADVPFAGPQGDNLVGLSVNGLHNIVHLLIGVAGLAASRRLRATVLYGWVLAVVYGGAFLYGMFVPQDSAANFLALDASDNGLHAVSAAFGLFLALLPRGQAESAAAAEGGSSPTRARG